MAGRKFLLMFPPALADQPITQRLWRDFDITVNILKAEIDQSGGRLTIELGGKPEEISRAIEFLIASKVRVEELRNYVRRDMKKCTDCGMCVSICPVKAYVMNPSITMSCSIWSGAWPAETASMHVRPEHCPAGGRRISKTIAGAGGLIFSARA